MMPDDHTAAERIVAGQTGRCLCCDEKRARWNCEKDWVRVITTALAEARREEAKRCKHLYHVSEKGGGCCHPVRRRSRAHDAE